MGQETALFVVNKIIEKDPVLNNIFAPKTVSVYPGYGDEPHDKEPSYPYIRYQSMFLPQKNLPYLRRDWCQYFVGDVDYTKVVNAIERLIYLLNIEVFESLGFWATDPSNKFKILDVLVHNSTVPNIPSQDLGVWEQGLAFSIRYTIIHQSWSVTNSEQHGIDVSLA